MQMTGVRRRFTRRSLLDRQERQPETLGDRLVGDTAAVNVEARPQMGFCVTAAKPSLASARPNGNVALFSAWLEVSGTAPGIFATQ